MAVLFVGVAASSAFQKAQLVELRPGQSTEVGGYTVRYERPTSAIVAAGNGRLERIDLGADLRVARGDGPARTLSTYKSYFPTTDPTLGPVSRFFEGEATTEVGLRAGVRRDLWTAVSPDIGELRGRIAEGDRVFGAARGLSAEQRGTFLAAALAGLARSYTKNPPPATFRIIASPLVTWIWLGALIVFAGGLVALWPAGATARSPATATGLARVARELGRA
jgi:cytochrome c-type biogenesis protein CcmF